ncbi:MAG: heparan-alpha-glucosaminide N-acetyltransferase [Archaeoglobaceae archaeon]
MLQVQAWTRLELVDFLRGFAVILMLIYHLFFDLEYFGKVSLSSPFWYFFPRFIGGTFIFVAGISLSLAKRKYGEHLTRKTIRRGAKYLLLGLVITAVTLPTSCYVRFGILHFFGLAVILGSFFAGYRKLSVVAGVILFIIGLGLNQVVISGEYLVWLGLLPPSFCSLDYYPLLPWLGVMLIGISVGNHFNLNFRLPDFFRPVNILGRKSLTIYMIQHPVILLLMQLYYGDIIDQIMGVL